MGCVWATGRGKCKNPPSTSASSSIVRRKKSKTVRDRLIAQPTKIVRQLMHLLDEGMSRSMGAFAQFWKPYVARAYARKWYSMQDSCATFLRVVHNDGTYTLVNETGTYPLPMALSALKSRVKVLGRHFYIRRGNTRSTNRVPTNDLRKEVERLLHDALTSGLERCIRKWEVVQNQSPSWKKIDMFVKIRGFNPIAGSTPRTQSFQWMYVDAKQRYPMLDVVSNSSEPESESGLRLMYVSDASRGEEAEQFVERYLDAKKV